MGIGNELNGDDAAGVLVVRLLARFLQEKQRHIGDDVSAVDRCASVQYTPMRTQAFSLGTYEILVVEGSIAPEAFGGPLRRFNPEWVILIDAAAMDEPAGAIAWVDWRLVDGLSATTHTMPPTMLAKYLIHEIGCQVGLIGIQPASVEMDEPIHLQVAEAIVEAADALYEFLYKNID